MKYKSIFKITVDLSYKYIYIYIYKNMYMVH